MKLEKKDIDRQMNCIRSHMFAAREELERLVKNEYTYNSFSSNAIRLALIIRDDRLTLDHLEMLSVQIKEE